MGREMRPIYQGVTTPTRRGLRAEEQREGVSDVDLAKAISFRIMANRLLDDIRQPALRRKKQVLIESGDQPSSAPLAKCVAEERLQRLGLLPNVILELGPLEEVPSVDPKYQPALTNEEKEARRAVVGYQWSGERPAASTGLTATLRTMIREADQAQEQLLADHLNAVKSMARKFKRKGIEQDDLIGVGNLALVSLTTSFDWRKGLPFRAYISRNLSGVMLHELRDRADLIRRPRTVWEHAPSVNAGLEQLMASGVTRPSYTALAEITGLSEQDVAAVLVYHQRRPTSLNMPNLNGSEQAVHVSTEDRGFGAVENRETVQRLLRRLPERERLILISHFYGGLTQAQIGDLLGFSQMHVSRLMARALKFLREQSSEIS